MNYGVSSDDGTVPRSCDMPDIYVHHFVYSESHQASELAVLPISHDWGLPLYEMLCCLQHGYCFEQEITASVSVTAHWNISSEV